MVSGDVGGKRRVFSHKWITIPNSERKSKSEIRFFASDLPLFFLNKMWGRNGIQGRIQPVGLTVFQNLKIQKWYGTTRVCISARLHVCPPLFITCTDWTDCTADCGSTHTSLDHRWSRLSSGRFAPLKLSSPGPDRHVAAVNWFLRPNNKQRYCGKAHVQSQWERANFDPPVTSN